MNGSEHTMKNPTKGMRRHIYYIMCAALLAFSPSCSDTAENRYADTPAFLRIFPVTALPSLHTSLNNNGYFCAVTYKKPYYYASGADGSHDQMNGTAMEAYGNPVYVSGIILGTPLLPDVNGNFAPVAYDQVCRNCYDEYINKPLTFSSATTATCSRCHRTYDLSTDGIVIEGPAGKRLLRYHVFYDALGDVLIVR